MAFNDILFPPSNNFLEQIKQGGIWHHIFKGSFWSTDNARLIQLNNNYTSATTLKVQVQIINVFIKNQKIFFPEKKMYAPENMIEFIIEKSIFDTASFWANIGLNDTEAQIVIWGDISKNTNYVRPISEKMQNAFYLCK